MTQRAETAQARLDQQIAKLRLIKLAVPLNHRAGIGDVVEELDLLRRDLGGVRAKA